MYYDNGEKEMLTAKANKRPTGITILSILGIIGGILMFATQIMFMTQFSKLSTELGVSAIILVLSMAFLGILGLASGIGMWLGKKWGWWLGAFYYVYAIMRYINALRISFSIGDSLQGEFHGIDFYLFKNIIRIIISSGILVYFFNNHVMYYFDVAHYSKIKSISKVIGVAIGVFAIASITALI